MGNKLSHSSVSKHQSCATAWKNHYVLKLRPIRQHAALCFGKAIDKATGAELNGENGHEVFDKFWRFQYVNNKQTYLPDCIDIVYAESDFDKDLIELDKLAPFELTLAQVTEAINYKEDKGYENLPDDQKRIANIGYWLCLLRKGHLMIDAFKRDIMPKITKVHSTQEMVSLENDEGDQVTGYLDVVVDLEGYGTVIGDVKTSAREYKVTAANRSPQLSLYVSAVGPKYNTNRGAFFVLSKQVDKNKKKVCKECGYNGSGGNHKTCPQEFPKMVANKKGVESEKMVRCDGEWNESIDPRISSQIIVAEISEATQELVMSNIVDINNSIKTGLFTKNLAVCENVYGKPCDFIKYCWEGSMDGLVKKEETNE